MREIIQDKNHDRNRSLGWLALAWIEHYCVHGRGGVVGRSLNPKVEDALPLGDEFAEFIIDCYCLSHVGRRFYKSSFVSRPKGWSKSELAALIALFEALGPARTLRDSDGNAIIAKGGEVYEHGSFRYEYEPGDFMGTPVVDPFIRCLATEETQAGNTYDNIIVNLDPDFNTLIFDEYGFKKSDVGLTRIFIPSGGEIVPSTASSNAKDGGKETFAVLDETHLWYTAELKRLYGVITRNLTKRGLLDEPWSLETSTMYAPGQDSVAEGTHKTAEMIRDGRVLTTGILFDHRQADFNIDLSNPDEIMAGLKEAYGDAAAYNDLQRMMENFIDVRFEINDGKRYNFNQPTSPSDAWISEDAWNAVKDDSIVLQPSDAITLGFDGSERSTVKGRLADATALVAVRISDNAVFPLGIWEQGPGPEDANWTAPLDQINEAVDFAFSTYDVKAFFADPAKWEGPVNDWEKKYGASLAIEAAPKVPIRFWNSKTGLIGRALEHFENDVLSGELIHNGDPHLTRHVLNARRKPRAGAMGIGKDHPSSNKKIDSAMAATFAHMARAKFLSDEPVEKPKRKTKFYAVKNY